MMKFSERHGHVPVRSVLQTSDVDANLRNRLWNLICGTFFRSAPSFKNIPANFLPNQLEEYRLFKDLWHNYFKKTTDTIGLSYLDAMNEVKSYFLTCQWFEVYDLLEFLAEYGQRNFIDPVNKILKEELSGYRFVSGRIVQVTSEQEIGAIEQALGLPDPLKSVREHLAQSLVLLSDRKKPDYRNSIKESISAVESVSKIITKQDKATLSPALNALEGKTKMHPALKEAFQKLYGYTGDSDGIRHALMDETTLDFEDAKFMLVSCSAFVNYLVVKAQKAGIKI